MLGVAYMAFIASERVYCQPWSAFFLREELIQSKGKIYYNMPLLLYCFLLHCAAKIDWLINYLIVVLCQVCRISAYLREHI